MLSLLVFSLLNKPKDFLKRKTLRLEQNNNYFSQQMAAAAALGALKLNRPVRLVLDMKTNMELIGKRYSYLIKYNVSFNFSSI